MGKEMYESREGYETPFDSFDWRKNLITQIRDLQLIAAIEILEKEPTDIGIEWKDDQGILNYALNEGLYERIHERTKALFDKFLAQ